MFNKDMFYYTGLKTQEGKDILFIANDEYVAMCHDIKVNHVRQLPEDLRICLAAEATGFITPENSDEHVIVMPECFDLKDRKHMAILYHEAGHIYNNAHAMNLNTLVELKADSFIPSEYKKEHKEMTYKTLNAFKAMSIILPFNNEQKRARKKLTRRLAMLLFCRRYVFQFTH